MNPLSDLRVDVGRTFESPRRTWSTLPACQQAYYGAAGTTTYSASSPIATRSPPPAS